MIQKIIHIVLLLIVVISNSILYNGDIIKVVDLYIYDIFSKFQDKKEPHSPATVIVNIDDKSLKYLGQWPWPRIIEAKLINIIDFYHPSAIGVNILFPELDRTSPKNIKSFYKNFFNIDINLNGVNLIEDNDDRLITSVKNSKSVLSIYFNNKLNFDTNCQNLTYKSNILNRLSTSFIANSVLCNHLKLQKSVEHFGFINVSNDIDGVFRRVHLFAKYRSSIFPFFGLAVLMSIDNIDILNKKSFDILTYRVNMNRDSTVLLNFNLTPPKIISVVDLLNNRVSSDQFTGKIVLIGSSITAIDQSYKLPNGKSITSSMISGYLIENILNNALLIQPYIFKKLNLAISIVISLITIFLLIKRYYTLIFVVFITTITISIPYTYIFFTKQIYISIGYLITPFMVNFFIINLLLIYINRKDKNLFYKELMKSHSSTVESIALVSAIRDDETGEHLQRTKIYVKELATYLLKNGKYTNILNDRYINLIYQAAPLHDIGKLGIPDKILKKPDKLTKEEFDIMKQHPILAKNAIEKAMRYYDKNDFLNIAYNIAYYHHERWDGKGYPEGLRGDNIPLEAQLMSIADVYDALVTKRYYKDKFSFEKAEDIIISNSNRHFNPVLVEAFIALKYRFREIALKYKDS